MRCRGDAPGLSTYSPAVTFRAATVFGRRSRDSPRLIRCQRVHGIDNDGLDAGRAGLGTAVVEHRIEEALGLARTGSRRDDRRSSPRQSVEGVALVAPGREAKRRFRNGSPPSGACWNGRSTERYGPLKRLSVSARNCSTTPDSAGFDGPKPVKRKSSRASVTSAARVEGIMGAEGRVGDWSRYVESARQLLRECSQSDCFHAAALG